MTERLVDVLSARGSVLHTYPISHMGAMNDDQFEAKALEAAAFGHLVRDADQSSLSAQMHVCRFWPLTRFGDTLHIMSQTRDDLEREVREDAYHLWQQEGCPENKAEDHWDRARHQRLRGRAYGLWERERHPEGRSDEIWGKVLAFEAC